MVKILKDNEEIPAAEYSGLRDAWYDEMLDGQAKEIEPADWQPRFTTIRSAASSLRQAAERRGTNYRVAVRGTSIYVAPLNGRVTKRAATKAVAKKAPAKKVAAKKAAPRKAAAKKVPTKKAT
jgi:uncharacterized protein (DUF58 family)